MGSDGQFPTKELPDRVNRTAEYTALTDALVNGDRQHVYVYGPKGAGKTLVARHALQEAPDRVRTTYLSCLQYDTQYKVLAALADHLTEAAPGSGYHTAQLTDHVRHAVSNQELVIALDDVDFLLLNDGEALLYFLTRLHHETDLRLVLIASACTDLSMELDERVYSSLLPATLYFEPYIPSETEQILTQRIVTEADQPVSHDAIAHVAASTANISLGLHWLEAASQATPGPIDEAVVRDVQSEAIQRYRNALLKPFSEHHRLLLESIELLTTNTTPVNSGQVYEWYRRLCRKEERDPLSTRRGSYFLKHLELLGLIRVDYHYGGKEGKTRRIWLQRP